MLPVLGDEYDMGNAHAVNSDGTIVGSCRRHVSPPIPQNPRACVWQEGQIRDLNTLTKYPEELLQRSANGVSDNGVIVVSGLSNDGNVAIVLAP